jgi:hypothetical protein
VRRQALAREVSWTTYLDLGICTLRRIDASLKATPLAARKSQ